MMRKKNEKFQSVGEILPQAIGHLHRSPRYKLYLLRFYWPEIVGTELAKRTAITNFNFGKLTIGVCDSSLASNLVYMSMELKEKVNTYFKNNLVESINFVYARENFLFPAAKAGKRAEAKSKAEPLSDSSKERIEQFLSKVEDADIEKSARKMLRAAARAKSLKKKHNWHTCAKCGVLCPPEEKFCPQCARYRRKEKSAAIREILLIKPWARYAEISRHVDCTQQEAMRERRFLVQRLAAQIDANARDDMQIKILVMLYRALPPEQLTNKLVAEILQQLRYDLSYQEMLKLGPKKGRK